MVLHVVGPVLLGNPPLGRVMGVPVAVAVTLGGVPVPAQNIVYSGAAPGTVEGLTQINVVIPSTVTPGPSVPVIVIVGGVQSQAGITLSVN